MHNVSVRWAAPAAERCLCTCHVLAMMYVSLSVWLHGLLLSPSVCCVLSFARCSWCRVAQVFRMSSDSIGCSLAEAAESESYTRYLQEASHTPNSLHVVYINTSLRTKATAHSLVPTITCTSSNVVQTVLQGFAQVRRCGAVWGSTGLQLCTVAGLCELCCLGRLCIGGLSHPPQFKNAAVKSFDRAVGHHES